MGRHYKTELQELDSTYSWALGVSIDELKEFLRASNNLPMLVVGSCDSLTSAIFASLLHQETGMISQYLAPLEMVSLNYSLHNTAVLFLTSGERNSDIITSFKIAVKQEPKELMILCATKGSLVGRIAHDYSYTHIFEFSPPSGRDGFLATNSLLAFTLLLTRAYGEGLSMHYKLPRSLDSLVHPNTSRAELLKELEKDVNPLVDKDNVAVLYGKWGKPGAFDLVSKFTGAALGNVLLADYRNFAHGWHHWLAKNAHRSGIIALITRDEEEIADRTLNLIPKDIPTVLLQTEESNATAALSLLIQIMYLVGIVGESRGIDPGRPGLPTFSSRIYNLQVSTPKKSHYSLLGLSRLEATAISRKVRIPANFIIPRNVMEVLAKACRSFVQNLQKVRFGAVVFDYDGTLCDSANRFTGAPPIIGRELIKLLKHGSIIGIATGRGKSVRPHVQKIIPRAYWSKVLIGYYNGSDIGSLDDNSHPNKSLDTDPILESFISVLKKQEYLNQIASYRCRPRQISFDPIESYSLGEVMHSLENIIRKIDIKGIQIVESTHSIHALAPGVSKLELVKSIAVKAKNSRKSNKILCVGDKGKWPGNDFALLSGPYSLSVDTVSPDLYSCWNLAPPGHRGEQAALDYLRAMEIKDGMMRFNCRKLEMEFT